jgi:hypothetical protein
VWTPTPDEVLEKRADGRLGPSWRVVGVPATAVALTTENRATGWLWGRQRTTEGVWLGLATIHYAPSWRVPSWAGTGPRTCQLWTDWVAGAQVLVRARRSEDRRGHLIT